MILYPFENKTVFKIGENLSDLDHNSRMFLAFELAVRQVGNTNPNPSVGSIIVKDGVLVGFGNTQPAGGDHAEVQALKMAGSSAQGAQMYVTLEPCSHFGKTPPCSHALVQYGVSEVYVSCLDQNPQVMGQGITYLEQQGLKVHLDIQGSFGRDFYQPFFHWVRYQEPWLVIKTAHARDGGMHSQSGKPLAITSTETNQLMSQLRRQSQAIVIGGGTARIDQPQLNLRRYTPGPDELVPTPRIYVLSRNPESIDVPWWKSLKTPGQLINTKQGLVCELKELLVKLGSEGVHQVLLEAGPGLARQLWDQKFFNQWVFLQSFHVISGEIGPWGLSKWYPNPLSSGEICKFGHTQKDQFLIIGNETCLQV